MTMDAGPMSLQEAIRHDGRYPPDAYEFLFRGLERAARQLHGERRGRQPRHVSGQDLCEGLRVEALHRWGPLARAVLGKWRIRRTRDFGEMVMFLVGLDVLSRQESDCIEDFDDVYEFEAAFGHIRVEIDE